MCGAPVLSGPVNASFRASSHDAGLACPQLSAAATDDDVGRLATTMLDRLARPPSARNGHLLKPDVTLHSRHSRATPAYSHRWATTLAAARVPLESCSRTWLQPPGSDTSQNKPAGLRRRGPNPSCCQAAFVAGWSGRIATPGEGAGGTFSTHVVPVVPLLVPRQEAVAQKAQIVPAKAATSPATTNEP